MASAGSDTVEKHALVFGASGVAGWAVVDQIFENYPKQGTFSSVTALVNRPLSIADSGWPKASPSRPQLDLVSRIDLTTGNADVFTALLKEKVKNVSKATHVFYFAYKFDQDAETESRVNRDMLERVLVALDKVAPNLAFVVLPTGTRSYGIYDSGGIFKAPFEESMVLSGSKAKGIFHFALKDVLREKSKGKSWTWCEIRPDAIIGFVPNGNAFNLPYHWATYLSIYALVEGNGATVPFPGTKEGYQVLSNEASADSIAKISIWASLHQEISGDGALFNIADQAKPSPMSERWPQLAQYFGLKGTGPVNDVTALKPSEYVQKHQDVLKGRGIKAHQGENLDHYGYHFTFDRQLSLEKARKAGFTEEIDPTASWFKAFDRFKKSGMIPA